MRTSWLRPLGAFLPLALAACGAGQGESSDVVPEPPPAYATHDLVGARMLELAALCAPAATPATTPAATLATTPAAADRDHMRGLAALVSGPDRGMRDIGVEEAVALGDACVPELLELALDSDARGVEREAAVLLLGALDTERAAEQLLLLLETAPEAWLRAHAAWRLGTTTQDWILPRLLLRMKYESDHETVIWMSKTLASFGNFTGLGVLNTVATTSAEEAQRASARARMQEIANTAGLDDAFELWRAWDAGDEHEAFLRERSPRFELEVMRWIARFDEFQLRGVDDGRFLLARLGPRGASLMGSALVDDSLYVRVNTSQSLQRMGRRGRPACPALLALLKDPGAGPDAALALGALACVEAEAALAVALQPGTNPDVRLACTRALGGFGTDPGVAPTTLEALRALARDESAPELRQASAESLAYLGHADDVLEVLLDCLTSRALESATTERALRAWLLTKDEPEVLAAWDALTFGTREIVSIEERQAARSDQRRVLENALEKLVPGPPASDP